MADSLERYREKRNFTLTSEPSGDTSPASDRQAGDAALQQPLSFVIQKHAASRLHYDFRLELDGTLKSWAVPKGPSLDPADKRMAVHVEDHPLSYANFEGTIPAKQYGAGTVIVWDRGEWLPIGDAHRGYADGKLKFELRGEKLQGHWTLVRMRGRGERQEPWLLIKERDDTARPSAEFSVVDELYDSVITPGSPLARAMAESAAKPATAASATEVAVKTAKAVKKSGATAVRKASTKKASAAESPASKTSDSALKMKRSDASTAKATPHRNPAQGTPEALPAGAKPSELPATLAPQLATLVDQVPSGDDWVYEIKFDGYRMVTRIEGADVRMVTRNGNDWTSRMPGLARAVAALGLADSWLDGEIIVQGAEGTPNFQLLQNAFDSSRTGTIQYFVFDLPFHAGHDLRQVPLAERRALMRQLLQSAPPDSPVHFSEDFEATVGDLLQTACQLGLEGVIGKRKDSIYSSRRSPAWIKLKCTRRQEFVIGGYTDPKGSRKGLGSLLLGVHDASGKLVFAGNVGTGFDESTLSHVTAQLEALRAERTPFADKPRDVKGNWVEPQLVAEISFSEWTQEGRVRHAVFHGLRTDKPAESIVKEETAHMTPKGAVQGANMKAEQAVTKRPARSDLESSAKPSAKKMAKTPSRSGSSAAAAQVAGTKITHPERVIDESSGITKLELAEYYERASAFMLPHLVARPVSLVRGPDGVAGQLFFQKHADPRTMPSLRQLDPAFDPEHDPLIEIDSLAGLLGAVQMNVIEFHTWNSTTRAIDAPDRMTFDLDPGEGLGFEPMKEAALLTRALLQELGLQSFVKTSGGKGLHVVVPLTPKLDWDTVKGLSEAVVQHLSATLPDRFVAKSGGKNRVGKIFVDYLRNGRGATTASAYSARARPGMGVSIPITWDELPGLTGGNHWTIRTAGERLSMKTDPWGDYAKTRQTLAKAMKLLNFKKA